MKKVLCFIYNEFADFEIVLVSIAINQAENYKMEFIAYDNSPVKSSCGLTIIPDKLVSDISQTDDIEGLIIPGGNDRIIKPELIKLVKKLNEEKKMLAAICAGPEFLAKIGVLNGVKYTASAPPEEYKEKKEEDPFPREKYIEDRVVQDGNIITAQGHAFVDFALTIWDWFNLYDNEKEKKELKIQFSPK
ncbi:MAG: DJ-1/PfpI family protein [Candidatus Thorarchaeota archaeon]